MRNSVTRTLDQNNAKVIKRMEWTLQGKDNKYTQNFNTKVLWEEIAWNVR